MKKYIIISFILLLGLSYGQDNQQWKMNYPEFSYSKENKKLNEISLDLITIAGFMLPDYGLTVKDYEKYMKWDGFQDKANQIYNDLEQLEIHAFHYSKTKETPCVMNVSFYSIIKIHQRLLTNLEFAIMPLGWAMKGSEFSGAEKASLVKLRNHYMAIESKAKTTLAKYD